MEQAKGTKFVVDFGDVHLPDQIAQRLSSDIRRATMQALAGLDLRGDGEIKFHFPREWLGIIAHLDQNIIKQIQAQTGPR